MPDWRRLSWSDRVAWVIGTGFGSGFSPIAPGTVGSAAAVVILIGWQGLVWIIVAGVGWADPIFGLFEHYLNGGYWQLQLWQVSLTGWDNLFLIVPGFFIGVWATGKMSTTESPDPGTAVWDEFVGMWIASLAAPTWVQLFWPYGSVGDWQGMLLALVTFRFFDIFKPWPCRRLEKLHGGWGIMLDDVAAGIWAALAVTIVSWLEFWALAWFIGSWAG